MMTLGELRNAIASSGLPDSALVKVDTQRPNEALDGWDPVAACADVGEGDDACFIIDCVPEV